jgi:hypothetical protein
VANRVQVKKNYEESFIGGVALWQSGVNGVE